MCMYSTAHRYLDKRVRVTRESISGMRVYIMSIPERMCIRVHRTHESTRICILALETRTKTRTHDCVCKRRSVRGRSCMGHTS